MSTETAITALHEALSDNGYRLTPARRAIVAALAEQGDHMTADALVELVNRESPSIGRMTVYRTLDLLCELGQLRPVYQGGAAAHYVLLHDGHHHHLICFHCQRVVEFDDCVIGSLAELIGERFDFEVQGHLLEFYGLCPDCRAG
jgi:Fur family ferric uptake transcriptional regulator